MLLTNSEKENVKQGQELNKIEIIPEFEIKNIFKSVNKVTRYLECYEMC